MVAASNCGISPQNRRSRLRMHWSNEHLIFSCGRSAMRQCAENTPGMAEFNRGGAPRQSAEKPTASLSIIIKYRPRYRDMILDKLSHNGVQVQTNLAHVPGRRPGDSVRRGECGSRGSRLVTLALGRLGQDTPGRHHDRTAGAISLDWDSKARVTPASDAWGPVRRLRVKMCCDALRLSNHRGARSEQVPGSRVARAERWRSVAAASAVVERREASGPRRGRASPVRARRLRNSAFRRSAFLFCFVIASEAKQSRFCAADPGLLRRIRSSQ